MACPRIAGRVLSPVDLPREPATRCAVVRSTDPAQGRGRPLDRLVPHDDEVAQQPGGVLGGAVAAGLHDGQELTDGDRLTHLHGQLQAHRGIDVVAPATASRAEPGGQLADLAGRNRRDDAVAGATTSIPRWAWS